MLCLAISSTLEVLPFTPSHPTVGKVAFSSGSPVPRPRPGSEGQESPDLVSPAHNTRLGFPRGFSAVGDPGRAASGDSVLRKAHSVTLGETLRPAWLLSWVHTLVERILLVEVEVGVDV